MAVPKVSLQPIFFEALSSSNISILLPQFGQLEVYMRQMGRVYYFLVTEIFSASQFIDVILKPALTVNTPSIMLSGIIIGIPVSSDRIMQFHAPENMNQWAHSTGKKRFTAEPLLCHSAVQRYLIIRIPRPLSLK